MQDIRPPETPQNFKAFVILHRPDKVKFQRQRPLCRPFRNPAHPVDSLAKSNHPQPADPQISSLGFFMESRRKAVWVHSIMHGMEFFGLEPPSQIGLPDHFASADRGLGQLGLGSLISDFRGQISLSRVASLLPGFLRKAKKVLRVHGAPFHKTHGGA